VKRPLLLTLIAGAAMFLVVLVLYLPAAWLAGFLPSQVHCADIGGSVWQGECLQLQIQGTPLGDASWNISTGSAFTGKLVGDVDVEGSAISLRADVHTNFSGVGELRNVKARLTLDPALLPQLPRDQRGTVKAEFSRVVLSQGSVPRLLEGFVELHDLRQVTSQPAELGSYRVDFAAGGNPDGSIQGKLRDLGGPFAVEGTVMLTPPTNYLVQGFITGRSADAERTVRQISLGAAPDPSGRSPFSFEGSY
jgi:hypothetical protein